MKTVQVAVPCKSCRGTGYIYSPIYGMMVCGVCVMTGTVSVYPKLVPHRNPHGTRVDIRQRRSA